MKRSSTVLLAAAVALSSCHARKVDPRTTQETQAQAQPEQQKPAPKKAVEESAQEADTRPPAEEGRPELSASGEGLMRPEGPRLIQEALADRGYLSKDHQTGELDAETSAALRRFQAAEEVARTGYPDRETVRKLGLSVARVFKGD